MSLLRRTSLVRTTAPSTPVVTTADMKLHLRVSTSTEDAYVDELVKAATAHCEQLVRRAFMIQNWRFVARGGAAWDGTRLQIPLPPLVAVLEVRVRASEDVAATVVNASKYLVDADCEPAVLTQLPGFAAGTVVEIDFTAGWATTAAMPAELRQAVKMLAAHLYENRETSAERTLAEIPFAVESLLSPWRMRWSA